MRFNLFFFFLQCTSLLIAQNHVNWSFAYDNVNSNIVITGTIDEGWHLYSQKTPANSGPIPVSISIDKQKGIKLIGKCEEKLVPHEIFDVNFDSKVYLFENSYLASQIIKLKNTNQIKGNVQYMVCNDTQCLPPIEVPFALIIK
jgi:thiol:disulfide interchange protein DsbD